MLRNTFSHIPGVSKETEKLIWNSNIYNWEEFLENNKSLNLSSFRKEKIKSYIKKSINAYQSKNHLFFSENIPLNLHWRAYRDFSEKCCFLDIETTGLDKQRNQLTVAGIYNGKESKFFINGKNLEELPNEIKKYSMIVSFNGRCFDVPFIKAKFPEIEFNHFHADLRFLMKNIGYTGGLKRIEKEIGLCRDSDLADVDGYEAVRLWHKYKKGDQDALKLLIKYNKADIENLKTMMDFAFDKLKEKDFLAHIE